MICLGNYDLCAVRRAGMLVCCVPFPFFRAQYCIVTESFQDAVAGKLEMWASSC